MYVYTLGQWLLFFFLYCFLGWGVGVPATSPPGSAGG